MQIIYIILAILGLSFLVFIHELGHYIVARRVGMRVEAFSIGFGKPIISWMFQGVRWQIGLLPFGGYVRIAGMEKEDGKEPHEIKDGFFGGSPWARIKVAIAGPLVNIVFAFVVFAAIWVLGGRAKPFTEYTNIIGQVDTHSELYEKGIRPGDIIQKYNGEPFTKYQDLLLASVANGSHATIEGDRVDYYTGQHSKYSYTLPVYDDERYPGGDLKTIGIMSPANFLMVQAAIPPLSPMYDSGIEKGDRIVWADGELIFSTLQLSSVINEQKTLLTVERDGKVLQLRVPRMLIRDLSDHSFISGDLQDWKYEIGKKSVTMFIPYALSADCVVKGPLSYAVSPGVDDTFAEEKELTSHILRSGDRVLAVDGKPVEKGYDVLRLLQEKKVLVIVDRGESYGKIPVADANSTYVNSVDWKGIHQVVETIGTRAVLSKAGEIHLLRPVEPIPMNQYPFTEEEQAAFQAALKSMSERAEGETDSQKRALMLAQIDKQQSLLVLGIPLGDEAVLVNPNPFAMMGQVIKDMGKTIASVTTGQISAKWMSGPVGIMQMMHVSWSKGVVEALYWLGIISLNLAVINLLPIPVLDGGHIVMTLYEVVTRRKLSAKAMQRLILPFAILIIAFFVYVTYNDIMRLF